MKPTRYWLDHVDPPTFLAADDLAFTRASLSFIAQMDRAAAATSDPAKLARAAAEIAAVIQAGLSLGEDNVVKGPTLH